MFRLKDDAAFPRLRGSRLPEVIDLYGGTIVRDLFEDPNVGLCVEVHDGSCWPIDSDWIMEAEACHHNFPDHGLRRSWCTRCSAIGHFDFRTGKFHEDGSVRFSEE